MVGTNIRRTWTHTRAQRLGICLLIALPCAITPGQVLMVGKMMNNFSFPPNASMTFEVESIGRWHNAPGAEDVPYSVTIVDHWRAMSDAGRYGRELRRESPVGLSQSRIVYGGGQRWTFEFDTGAPPDADIAGRVFIRSQGFRGARWRIPLVEYFDRVFSSPGRDVDNYELLQVDATMVPIDGHPCHVVQGEWNGREFAFWLDPEFGYLPRKYTMRLLHGREENLISRGGPGPAENRVVAPPELQELFENPIQSEERMGSVKIEQTGDRFYIASAILEKTRTYAGGVSHTEHLTFRSTDFTLAPAPDADAFLSYSGLLRDGTRVEETIGGRFEPVSVNHYVFEGGEMVEAAGIGVYFRKTWDSLKVLARDFSIENLRRIDSTFLVAICAGAALLINGFMAYAAHRKKRAKAPEPKSINS